MRSAERARVLQERSPAHKPQEGRTVLQGEVQETPCGDVIRVEQAAAWITQSVRFDPPSQERGAPWAEEVRPSEVNCNKEHPNPQHGRSESPRPKGRGLQQRP